MHPDLNDSVIATIKSAAKKLKGFDRRQFQAETAIKYCDGNPRVTENLFGWNRTTVNTGINELRTGIRCLADVSTRGRPRSEDQYPVLIQQIREIVDPKSQADPTLQTPLAYTRITASAVQKELADRAVGTDRKVPATRTVDTILKRLGYRMRRVRKTVPKKKSPKPTRSLKT